MGVRFSHVFRSFEAFFGFGALRNGASRVSIVVILAAVQSAALASPDCSNAGLKPSGECSTKLEYCKHTSIVLVLAVRGRESGMTESDNFSKLSSNSTHENWYVKYSDVVKDIVHQVYTKESAYQKLRARIAPSMALAVSALTDGCNADTSVTLEPR